MTTTTASVAPQNPVLLARLALTKLAEASLAPTPENYASEYRRAAGLPDCAPDERHAEVAMAERAALLMSIAQTLGQTTSGLAVGMERFDDDLKSIDGDVDQLGADALRSLIGGLTRSKLALQKTVEASRAELEATRKHLEVVTTELEHSRSQARLDALTGFVNRRGMDEILVREIARARRTKSPLSLAILDLDHFKRVNDEHGHQTGDQALVHLAALTKAGLRESDVVCRYGGEEFVVILPDIGMQGALFVIDRLRVMLEKTPLPIEGGKLHLRFSAGIAELSAAENRDRILMRADAALYAAKRAGRNRVRVAQEAAA